MLLTSEQVDNLLSELASLSGLDEELVQRCTGLMRTQRYDEAVGQSFVVLETRLRKALGASRGTGVRMSAEAFDPDQGSLSPGLGLPRAETEGMRDLFIGAFKAFRNRAAHTVADYSAEEALGIINLVNMLIRVVDSVGKLPDHPILRQAVSSLGPQSSAHLLRLLDDLEDAGYRQGSGLTWLPYKANLMYVPQTGGDAKPYMASVLYVRTKGGGPILALNSKTLHRVPDLDLGRLESDLLALGWIRHAATETPIRLMLEERCDESALAGTGRLLRELIRAHGA